MTNQYSDAISLCARIEELCDRAYIEEEKLAQSEVVEMVRNADEIIKDAGCFLRACDSGFLYHLGNGDLELAQFFLAELERVIPFVFRGRDWDKVILNSYRYSMYLNGGNYNKAKKVATEFVNALRTEEISIDHSLKVDFPQGDGTPNKE
jgi:hypothetical protein